MSIDLGTLKVEKLIVHDVPNRPVSGASHTLNLSEIESPLDQGLKNYFREKISATLGSAFDVLFDPTSGSPVPRLVLDNLDAQKTDFVAMSRSIAEHLYNSQTGVNSAGLLCVSQVQVMGRKALAIVKLEREAALRMQLDKIHGKYTFKLEHLRDLILSGKTRVFKVGLFWQTGSTLASIYGMVSDNQRGYTQAAEVADFFLRKFLGCQLREAPSVTTKQFFNAAEQFVSEEIKEPETKARYEVALLAEMKNQMTTINPRQFAELYLDVDDRNKFISHLYASGIPVTSFDKDTSLVDGRIKTIALQFQSGILITGKENVFKEKVQMKDLENGLTQVEIRDKVQHVRGAH